MSVALPEKANPAKWSFASSAAEARLVTRKNAEQSEIQQINPHFAEFICNRLGMSIDLKFERIKLPKIHAFSQYHRSSRDEKRLSIAWLYLVGFDSCPIGVSLTGVRT